MGALGTEFSARATGSHTALDLGTDGLLVSGVESLKGPRFLCDLVFWVNDCAVHAPSSLPVLAEPECQC